MAKFGIYRVEQGPDDQPYTELKATELFVTDGVYKFNTHNRT